MSTETINGKRVFHYPADGQVLTGEQDALDLIGAVYGQDVDIIAIPADRLAGDFFRLRTGFAGAFIQKLQNYGCRLAVVGDIGGRIEQSTALRDFVRESNRRNLTLFVAHRDALAAGL